MRTIGLGAMVLVLAAGCPRRDTTATETPAPGDGAADAAGEPTGVSAPEPGSPGECVEPTDAGSIGSATMEADGTIVLMLRAEGEGGVVGDAMFSYPPGHAEYQGILDHVCGLEPGQSKPVPPWPED